MKSWLTQVCLLFVSVSLSMLCLIALLCCSSTVTYWSSFWWFYYWKWSVWSPNCYPRTGFVLVCFYIMVFKAPWLGYIHWHVKVIFNLDHFSPCPCFLIYHINFMAVPKTDGLPMSHLSVLSIVSLWLLTCSAKLVPGLSPMKRGH